MRGKYASAGTACLVIAVFVISSAAFAARKVQPAHLKRYSEMKVENTPNGVVVTITAQDPAAIAGLQEEWAKRAAKWNEGKKLPRQDKKKEGPKKAAGK